MRWGLGTLESADQAGSSPHRVPLLTDRLQANGLHPLFMIVFAAMLRIGGSIGHGSTSTATFGPIPFFSRSRSRCDIQHWRSRVGSCQS